MYAWKIFLQICMCYVGWNVDKIKAKSFKLCNRADIEFQEKGTIFTILYHSF